MCFFGGNGLETNWPCGQNSCWCMQSVSGTLSPKRQNTVVLPQPAMVGKPPTMCLASILGRFSCWAPQPCTACLGPGVLQLPASSAALQTFCSLLASGVLYTLVLFFLKECNVCFVTISISTLAKKLSILPYPWLDPRISSVWFFFFRMWCCIKH